MTKEEKKEGERGKGREGLARQQMESWLVPAGFAAGQAQAFPSTRLHPKGLLLEQVVSKRQRVTLLLQELLQLGPYLHSSHSPLVLFAPAEPFYRRLKADNIWAYSWRERWHTLTHDCVFLCAHTKSCLETPTYTFSRSWVEFNWVMIGRVLSYWWCVYACVYEKYSEAQCFIFVRTTAVLLYLSLLTHYNS